MKKHTLILLAALLLTACAEEVNSPSVQDGAMAFIPTVADEGFVLTRGTEQQKVDMLTADSGETLFLHTMVEPRTSNVLQPMALTRGTTLINSMDDFANLNDFKFGVSAARYQPTTKPLADQNANMFYNAEATFNIGAWWINKEYYLPATSEQLAFYAYWPYDNYCTDITAVKGDNVLETGPMRISFKVNTTDMTKQTDLMTATVVGQSYAPQTPVTLPFRHALTAVNFKIGADLAPGYIKRIELQNVCTAGEYTLSNNGVAPGTWNATDKQTITLDFTNGGTTIGLSTIGYSGVLNSSTGPLLLIPQTFSEDTQRIMLCINDSDDGTDTHGDHYLSKPLSEITSWEEGTVVTYLISTSSINYLRVNSVSYPTLWGTETFDLKSDYDANETMGVYVVDETGKVIAANVPYYKTTLGGWTTNNPSSVPYSTEYKFFAYYPYTAGVSGGHVVGDTFLGTNAADFFSGLIGNWALNDDQSNKDYFLSRDLQICRATAGSTFSKMSFPMQHYMGLAVLNLEQTALVDEYYLTTDANYTWTDNAGSMVTASSSFSSTAKPCATATATKYYYMQKPSATVTFTAAATTANDAWNAEVTTTAIAAYGSANFTAPLSTSNTTIRHAYTMAIGDVYFTDGSLGRHCNDYGTRKTAIGIVFSTTPSDKDKTLYPHGYVMASRGSFAGLVKWCTNTTTVTGNGYLASTMNAHKGDMDGRTKTERIVNNFSNYKTLFPAVNAAVNTFTSHYAPPAKPRSSGWFLPSSGHFFAWLSMIAQECFGTGNWGYAWRNPCIYFTYKGSELVSPEYATATNKFHTDRGFRIGDDNFTTADWSSTAQFSYWTSSEVSVSVPLDFRYGQGKWMWITNEDVRTTELYVRAALAF